MGAMTREGKAIPCPTFELMSLSSLDRKVPCKPALEECPVPTGRKGQNMSDPPLPGSPFDKLKTGNFTP
jgi:hypothetical protein